MNLDLHPASDAERIAAYRNVFDVWPMAATIDEHLRRRLVSIQHNRARWFVGCVDGAVATSLACYPLEFSWRGDHVRGVAIGSVHTAAEYRGQGLAPRLFAYVEEYVRREGAKLSLLYSDIAPGYYARLGYTLCPAHEAWIDPRVAARNASQTAVTTRLVRHNPFQPTVTYHEETGELDVHGGIYTAIAPGPRSFAMDIVRTDAYWRYLVQKRPDDLFLALAHPQRRGKEEFDSDSDADGNLEDRTRDVLRGYVRLQTRDDAGAPPFANGTTWRIVDYAVHCDAQRWFDELLQGIIQLAAAAGVTRLGGWLPDVPVVRQLLEVRPRGEEITMIKSLDGALDLTDEEIAAADWFREIDHV